MALRGVARLLVPSKVHHPGHVIDCDARLRDVGSNDYLAHTCIIAACCIISQGDVPAISKVPSKQTKQSKDTTSTGMTALQHYPQCCERLLVT